HGQVHQAGRDDAAARVDGAVGAEALGDVAHAQHAAGGQGHVADLVEVARGIDHAAIADQDLHAASRTLPATMPITAMRTAMPKVTCGRITLCLPSTTSESISTPRLIGPGCITIASGLARVSRSGVRP